MKTRQRIYLPFKRLIDIIGALIGIIFCFSLLWWWIFILNLFETKGHPIFCQGRYGKNRKIFKMFKFRSMKIDANPNLAPSNMEKDYQNSLETRFGRFLRKTSLDETLQLFNILFGQMAFIGPRPGSSINEEELVKLRLQYAPNAFDVKPGLSGLAQIKMRRDHNPETKARLDHEYVKHLSLVLDLKIFIKTIISVICHNDGAK